MNIPKVLFIDDNTNVRRLFFYQLKEWGKQDPRFQEIEVEENAEFMPPLGLDYNLIITDYNLGKEVTGIDVLKEIPHNACGILISMDPEVNNKIQELPPEIAKRCCFVLKGDWEDLKQEMIKVLFS